MATLGTIKIPLELQSLIERISDEKEGMLDEYKPDDFDSKKYNEISFLLQFNRLVDPVIIAMFIGLFKSQSLPPEQEKEMEIDLEVNGEYEFNVDIEKYKELFNNYLLCLWIKRNGYPNKDDNIYLYREELYDFLKEINDDDYFEKIIIPFYTKKSCQEETKRSFISRLEDSGYVGFKKEELSMASPEFLGKELINLQDKFWENVIMPLNLE